MTCLYHRPVAVLAFFPWPNPGLIRTIGFSFQRVRKCIQAIVMSQGMAFGATFVGEFRLKLAVVRMCPPF